VSINQQTHGIAIIDLGSNTARVVVMHTGPGYSPREIALIALLARYHRQGTPILSEYELLMRDGDDILLTRLAAILRLSEFLERGRNATVDDVAVVWDDDTLHLTLIADEYPAVELWDAERNAASLVESAFNRRAIMDSTAPPAEWSPHHGPDSSDVRPAPQGAQKSR
jgi:exopolyphosphatase/guanosine-5'-triphosphate,3'-diphosphate pyrophosphatase